MWNPQDIELLVKMPKILRFPLPEPQTANNAKFVEVIAPLHRHDGTDIAGLRFYATWRTRNRPGTCNIKLTLQAFVGGRWNRILQIEVYEAGRRAHTAEDGNHIYGPEIQYNEKHRCIITRLDCDSDKRLWMRRFMRHTNITAIRTEDSLFKWELEP